MQMALAFGFAAAILVLTHLLGPKKPNPDKMGVYECGVEPLGEARIRFSIKFYLVAMLFVLFDIEAIFMYPWAIVYKSLLKAGGSYIFWEMAVFLGILFVGLIYAWKRGALEWQ
jgi:NADH-quinone oxidoreductase subunit A